MNTEKAKFDFKTLLFTLFFPLSLLYCDYIVKVGIYKEIAASEFLYTLLFSIAFGLLFCLLSSLFSKRINTIIALSLSFVICVYYSFQYLYFSFFQMFFEWSAIGMAGQATEFWREALGILFSNIHILILMFVPFILGLVLRKSENFAPQVNMVPKIVFAASAVVVYSLTLGSVYLSKDSEAYKISTQKLSVVDSVRIFGLTENTVLDLKQCIFGVPEIIDELETDVVDIDIVTDVEPEIDETTETTETPVVYGPNTMDIDFDKLIENESDGEIKTLHKYFSSQTPSMKNEYTGMFEGKNLIMMTMEGFSTPVISKELTPTLYKMANEGFVFENFYTSLWGGSTATGEYTATTGLIWDATNCLKLMNGKSFPFCLGNQLSKQGYKTVAYHNNTYTYYDRQISHPLMGYDYKGVGNGLNGLTNSWPRSDDEMAKLTVDEYVNDAPFHAYYMTVSGHAAYTYYGNNMSTKHKDEVEDALKGKKLGVKAYIACNLEVEYMLQTLIEELDKNGQLENTVFAMSADHFPYALDKEELAQLYGLPAEDIYSNFDLYRNSFILWSPSMTEPIKVTKPCSSLDILPTLSNLFGLEYDSRLMPGRDILSDSPAFVILNGLNTCGSWHWITEQGSYNNRKKVFTPSENCTLSDDEIKEYVNNCNKLVSQKTTSAKKILSKNYYKHVFGQ